MMIEDCIDELPQDIDVDGANGQLTLTFPDGSQIVISRQPVQRGGLSSSGAARSVVLRRDRGALIGAPQPGREGTIWGAG